MHSIECPASSCILFLAISVSIPVILSAQYWVLITVIANRNFCLWQKHQKYFLAFFWNTTANYPNKHETVNKWRQRSQNKCIICNVSLSSSRGNYLQAPSIKRADEDHHVRTCTHCLRRQESLVELSRWNLQNSRFRIAVVFRPSATCNTVQCTAEHRVLLVTDGNYN